MASEKVLQETEMLGAAGVIRGASEGQRRGMKQASDRHEAASWGIQGASGDHQGHDEGLKGASQGQHGGITRAL